MSANITKSAATSLVFALLLTGCNERKEAGAWLAVTSRNLASARSQIGSTPYKTEQQLAFKSYFSGLAESVLRLKQDPKHGRAFNKALGRLNINDVCGRSLMARSEWAEVARNCMRNRFFICAEEVRAYPELLNSLVEQLSPNNKALFGKAPACRRSIKD